MRSRVRTSELWEGVTEGRPLVWLASAGTVMVVLVAVDLSLPKASIAAALVLTPFLASAGTAPGAVTLTGTVATVVAVGLAFDDRSSLGASATRLAVIVVGTALASQASRLRILREQRLVDLTNVAEAAQRAILPSPPPMVGPVRVATWYQSAIRAATVGGDCYEALDTPFGTRLLIADVRGHGLPSVRLAALVLGAFRALAYLQADLRSVAHELDLLTVRHVADRDRHEGDGEEFVTALLAEVDGTTVTFANCGHPPPIMVTADAIVHMLDSPHPTPPLGIGSQPHLQRLEVPPHSRFHLYTDGLIEARNPSGGFFDLAAEASRLAQGPLTQGLADLTSALRAHANHHLVDDAALVLFEVLATSRATNER